MTSGLHAAEGGTETAEGLNSARPIARPRQSSLGLDVITLVDIETGASVIGGGGCC